MTSGMNNLGPFLRSAGCAACFQSAQIALHVLSLQILSNVQCQRGPLWSLLLACIACVILQNHTNHLIKPKSQHSDVGRASIPHQQQSFAGWGVSGYYVSGAPTTD